MNLLSWFKFRSQKSCKSANLSVKTTNEIHPNSKRNVCAPKIHQSSEFLKLNADCMEEICEWLSLRDLDTLCETCKVMRQFVVKYFQKNYAITGLCESNCMSVHGTYTIDISNLSPFIKHVMICNDQRRDSRFTYISENCRSVEQLSLHFVTLSDDRIALLKPLLSKVQCIVLAQPRFQGEFYEKFLKHCGNLSKLCMQTGREILMGSSNNWMQRKYPSLKNVEITQIPATKFNKLKVFFEKNPQLECLAVNSSLVWKNQGIFCKCKVKLNDFAIIINFEKSRDYPAYFQLFNRLHKQGFFQQIHLYIYGFDKSTIRQMESLQAFVKLYVANCTLDRSVASSLVGIKELATDTSENFKDIENLAKDLVNLERLYMQSARIDDILPFIEHSKKLRTIQVKYLKIEQYANYGTLDLSALNTMREQLKGARKITLFIAERLYLKTKFIKNTTEYPLIEIKRSESYEWDHHFVI